ncbi:MAG: hypothetical protein ACK4RV_01060 [Caulobacter sp.]
MMRGLEDLRRRWNGAALLVGVLAAAAPAIAAEGPRLRPTDLGAYALFTDLDSIEWTGRTARVRLLQVTGEGFEVAGVAYVGGWRHFEIDCAARTVRETGFSSLRADGVEGPLTGIDRPAEAVAAGGLADMASRVVCEDERPLGAGDLAGVDAAVEAGRRWIPTGEADQL